MAGHPYLLYMVAFRRADQKFVKFGVGEKDRVRAHVGQGGWVLQVVRGAHEHVVAAERALLAKYRPVSPKLPLPNGNSECRGWAASKEDLRDWIDCESDDVTDKFPAPGKVHRTARVRLTGKAASLAGSATAQVA